MIPLAAPVACRPVTTSALPPRRRRLRRAGVGAVLTVLATVGSATPALARTVEDGELPADPLGLFNTLLIFVGAPVAVFAVISALVVLPRVVRSQRYRPARGWGHDPVWFAGPDDALSAVQAARTSGTAGTPKGGASGSW